MSAQSKYYNTGGGELYFSPLVLGVLGAEVAFGQTENINFSSEIETLTHDNTEGSVTVEDLSILKKITGSLAIETVEISPEMLTRAFLGTNFTANVGAGTLVAQADITVDDFVTAYPLSVKHIDTSTIVVKDDTDVTTYVLNTDYTISTVGDTTFITFIAGTIIATDVIHVTADNFAHDTIRVEAFLQSKIEGQLRFVSASANGVSYEYTFHKVSLLASGDFALKSAEEFAKISFEGAMLASELITDPNESKLFVIKGTELTA